MSSILLKDNDVKISKTHTPAIEGTSYEVFRNNTTAVEVVVKDVLKNRKKCVDDMKLNRAQADVDNLHSELDKAHKMLVMTKQGFCMVLREMRKQLEASSSRESETHAANLALKLENEKLKILLDSKTKLLCRSKKELNGLKRILKSIVKHICNAPELPGNTEPCSETDYEDFESEVKSNARFKFPKTHNRTDTFDTTFSLKDNSIEK